MKTSMVKTKRAKLTHTTSENTSEEYDPTSSTQASAADSKQASKPDATSQPEETNLEEDVDPTTVIAAKVIVTAATNE